MWPFQSHKPTKEYEQDATGDPLLEINQDPPPRLASERTLEQQRKEKLDRQEWLGYKEERLGMVFPLRAILLMSVSFIGGASLGAAAGSGIAADRYRAENAHRLPTNTNGWYLYHKSKNYHAMLGGMKEGAKFGGILTGWAFMFMVTEEVVDQSRARIFARGEDEKASGQRDAASTVISAMTIAGMYSWKQGFDKFAAARTAKMALKWSLIYGLAQDTLATLRGSQPAYINWIASNTFWPNTRLKDI